ncbi:MAG: PAS domain S-box protein [Gemmatimonadetes bacterium]|nr:PAS domain S-box protein [Gemmatimonadota bacterium]
MPDRRDFMDDLPVLYELSLSVGHSLDLRRNCESFLRTLMLHKAIDVSAVWVRSDEVPGARATDGYTCVYTGPAARAREDYIPDDHPLAERMAAGAPFFVNTESPAFGSMVTEDDVTGGAYAVLPLDDIGFLKLYSSRRDPVLSGVEYRQLAPLVDLFTVTVRGWLTNMRLADEVSRRKRAESELRERLADLRESRKRYRELYESNPSMYFRVGRDGRIVSVNDFGATHLGFTVAELTGRPVLELFHPDDRDTIAKQLEVAFAQTGVLYDWKTRKVHRNGSVMWVEEYVRAVRNEEGSLQAYVVCQDITERVAAEAERRGLEAQLRQGQKMKSLGTLAGGIAHDFNNLLAVILGNTQLVQGKTQAADEAQENLAEIMRAGLRAKQLVEQILAFSRKSEQHRSTVVLADVISESLEMLRSTLPPTIDVRERVSEPHATVNGDETQIEQVIVNICTNAAHAMQKTRGGILEVSLDAVTSGPQPTVAGLHEGEYLRLAVRDTGEGMSPDRLDRIFDPFFTTKPRRQGTGLGLAVVYGIVRDHGGLINVDSREGHGTTFTVFFPRTEADPAPAGPAEAAPRRSVKDLQILFVDDEAPITRAASQMLRAAGHRVDAHVRPDQALQRFEEEPDRYDVVVTDLAMPEMSGDELARKILALRPKQPIVLCTGFSERLTPARAAAMGIREFLMKPLLQEELIAAIERVVPADHSSSEKTS